MGFWWDILNAPIENDKQWEEFESPSYYYPKVTDQ